MAEQKVEILKHFLVPEHIVLTEEEKKKVLQEKGIVEQQLPKILKNDPVVKEIKAKEGDVIKITRSSPTAGVTTYYRTVVKGV